MNTMVQERRDLLRKCLEDAYIETKDKATSAMIWVLSTLTRSPNELFTSYLPIMWYPSSARLTAAYDRQTNMEIIRQLTMDKALNIVANTFDAKSRLTATKSGKSLCNINFPKLEFFVN